MQIRPATPDDALAVLAIYAPVVTDTAISFETEPPTLDEMRARILATLRHYPWLVALDDAGRVAGYVYASRHAERAAYRWSVGVTAYVRADQRGRGVGKALYLELLRQLKGWATARPLPASRCQTWRASLCTKRWASRAWACTSAPATSWGAGTTWATGSFRCSGRTHRRSRAHHQPEAQSQVVRRLARGCAASYTLARC